MLEVNTVYTQYTGHQYSDVVGKYPCSYPMYGQMCVIASNLISEMEHTKRNYEVFNDIIPSNNTHSHHNLHHTSPCTECSSSDTDSQTSDHAIVDYDHHELHGSGYTTPLANDPSYVNIPCGHISQPNYITITSLTSC